MGMWVVNHSVMTSVYQSQKTQGHNKKLFVDHTKIDARRFYFGCRVVKPWNSLGNEVVNAPSVESFKILVKKCDLSSFLSVKL